MNINSKCFKCAHCVDLQAIAWKNTSVHYTRNSGHPSLHPRDDIGFSIHLHEVTWQRTSEVGCFLTAQCRKKTNKDSLWLLSFECPPCFLLTVKCNEQTKAHPRLPLPMESFFLPLSWLICPFLALKLLAGTLLFPSFILWFFCVQEGKPDFGEQFSWNLDFNWTNRYSEGIA